MSNFYDEWLEEAKASAKAGMCDRFPVSIGIAYLFTGHRRPRIVQQPRSDSPEEWLQEMQEMIARHKTEGILFRIRLSITEDWPVEWSESIDRSEKDAAVICLLHKSLPQSLFWAAAVGEPTFSVPDEDDPEPNPEEFLQLGRWIEIDGSSVPDEFKNLMDGV
jgi:hypothetical protein